MVLLPCDAGTCECLELQLWTADENRRVDLSINDTPLGGQTLHPGWNLYDWPVPATSLHTGVNSLIIQPEGQIRLGDILIAKTAR